MILKERGDIVIYILITIIYIAYKVATEGI